MPPRRSTRLGQRQVETHSRSPSYGPFDDADAELQAAIALSVGNPQPSNDLQAALANSVGKALTGVAEDERSKLIAEQNREYEEALRADQAKELAAKQEEDRKARIHAEWFTKESKLGSAPSELANHQLRLIAPNGARLDVAFDPNAKLAALYALVEDRLGTANFHILTYPDPALPISTIPNRSVIRVALN